MSHCRILVEGNLFYEVYKAYHSYDSQYLSEMFKKPWDEYNTRNGKALVQHKCNSTTCGSHSLKYEGARMWNKLYVF